MRRALALTLLFAWGCSGSDDGQRGAGGAGGVAGGDAGADVVDSGGASGAGGDASAGAAGMAGDGAADAAPAPCPPDMVQVVSSGADGAASSFCIDRYEAPNRAGDVPLVMYTFVEAEAWCGARGKRLCFDDEWTLSCAGPLETKYPYGDVHAPGTCNDDKSWKLYDQTKLNGWPGKVSTPTVESYAELIAAAKAVSPTAAVAADHVDWLYQAEPAGQNASCVGESGAYDTQGNVEEWTRRRSGGAPDFHGNLKGRYWAEPRTCQGNVTVHGDQFRFYEIGFRCCRDPS